MEKINDFTLTEGEHTLTIAYREDGAELDKISISNAAFAPSGMGEEAENICGTTGIGRSMEAPGAFELDQNYPNPFNPVSTIRYELPRGSEVSLVVYNILGREVAKLIDTCMEPGYHELHWNGQEFASGIYFAQLVTPEYSKSIKMVLLK
ncbi:T9SS type A sorting domain-containing protein [Candidatus Neomarinimicrobiota bacterium]